MHVISRHCRASVAHATQSKCHARHIASLQSLFSARHIIKVSWSWDITRECRVFTARTTFDATALYNVSIIRHAHITMLGISHHVTCVLYSRFVKVVHISILTAVQLEPQVSELTATFLCRTMRVRTPPNLLLQTDHSFKKFNSIYINARDTRWHLFKR